MSTTAIVILTVVIVHFVIGIGYLMYKLGSSSKGSAQREEDSDTV